MRTLEQVTHTVADNSLETRFITSITDSLGVVVRYEYDSRNYSKAQKAEFIAAVGAIDSAKYIILAGW